MKDSSGRQHKGGLGDQATILLVEDEGGIRSMAKMFLETKGYSIIEAESGPDAVAIWKKKQSQIDLVVTDVDMPDGFTGRQLAQRLQVDRPDLKVIFSSGYSCDLVGGSDLLDANSNFLQKPYRLSNLVEMIRHSLDAEKAA